MPVSGADAAARLRYVAGVRARTRRAALGPALVVTVAGVVVALHALLAALWPHDAGVAAGFLVALLVARVGAARRLGRVAWRRGLVGRRRLALASGAGAAVAIAVAVAAGANLLVSSAAGATAVAAYLAGVPSVAAAALVTGAIGDAVIASGVPRATGELLVGAGLVAVGLACRAVER